MAKPSAAAKRQTMPEERSDEGLEPERRSDNGMNKHGA
jgi:hypothetical protein